jgi:hypothetical protein
MILLQLSCWSGSVMVRGLCNRKCYTPLLLSLVAVLMYLQNLSGPVVAAVKLKPEENVRAIGMFLFYIPQKKITVGLYHFKT